MFQSTRNDSALISSVEFKNALTFNEFNAPTKEQYDNVISGAPKGQITSKRELAMFLANVIHESGGLKYKEEIDKSGEYLIGEPAPGQVYYGRGYMQLSHPANYLEASRDLYGDDRLWWHPDLVATNDKYAWDTAFWYWKKRVHNQPGVQEGNFGPTIRAINGMECDGGKPDLVKKRIAYYEQVLKAFNVHNNVTVKGC